MGKQTRFYMEREKEEEFVKFAYENGFYILEECLNMDKVCEYKTFEEYILFHKFGKLYFYKEEYNNLIIDNEFPAYVDELESDVIEFSRTGYAFDNKCIYEGRIWFEYKYYDDNENLVIKKEQLVKDYEMLSKWIKKKAPLKEYHHGDFNDNFIVKEHITEKMLELNKEGKYIFL